MVLRYQSLLCLNRIMKLKQETPPVVVLAVMEESNYPLNICSDIVKGLRQFFFNPVSKTRA